MTNKLQLVLINVLIRSILEPAPTTHADFRPISITPVLTRIFEKIIVHRYIYPALLAPPTHLPYPFYPYFWNRLNMNLGFQQGKTITIPSVTRLSFKGLPSSTSQTTFLIGFRTIYRTTLTVLSTTIIHQIFELSLPV